MEPRADGSVRFANENRLVGAWLRWRGEPFSWGLPRARVPAFLEARGFALKQLATSETLRARYLNGPARLAEGESLCVAQRVGGRP